MDSFGQMFLIIGDDRHLLREGITLVGSADNDRYGCIRLPDESVCPKHAALRWVAANQDLDVMDLCSHGGTQLTAKSDTTTTEIAPLEWHRASVDGVIVFGSFKARFECSSSRTRKLSESFFDDSCDIVDCSLEETPQIRSRTETKKLVRSNTTGTPDTSNCNASQVIKDTSFVIPATQPAANTSANASTRLQANDSHPIGRNGSTEDDDDDMFYIPETQEQIQNSVADESQIIEPIGNTLLGRSDKEDEDFLRFETMDDENTGDGMFNNPYVEQSQNLLHNLDESYKREMAGADQRKSILPDRSVDSISFHGKLPTETTTDDELSKIEWNETRNPDTDEAREGSVTPELTFDKPEAVAVVTSVRNPMLDTLLTEEPRVDSVTPDLEFDRITPQQKELTGDAGKLSLFKAPAEVKDRPDDRAQSVTPDLDFEEQPDDEPDISLNQEGAFDPYDLATQPILADKKDPPTFKVPSASPYDLLTQKMPAEEIDAARPLRKLAVGLVNLKSTMMNVSFRANKQIELDPFELATQALPQNDHDDAYDLQTQPLERSVNDTIALDLPPPSSSKVKRKASTRQSKKPLDPFLMATQPLPVEKPNDLYDLQTQLLDSDQNDTVPLAIVVRSPPREPTDDDAYDLQTQPLLAQQNSSSSLTGEDDDAEVTQHFRPKGNSTYRQSLLVKHFAPIPEEREEATAKDDANISPSSNKENREEVNASRDADKLAAVRLKSHSLTSNDSKITLDGSQPTDEGLDDDYCLTATLPMTDASSKDSGASGSKRSKRSNQKQDSKSIFKKPDYSAASSSKGSLPSGLETPRSRQASSSAGTADTDTFDFNTPEHPFLDIAKKDKILAISDMITSRPVRADSLAKRNKYIFGDSSDEDEDPTAPVFVKEDSKIRVMKYDKDEDAPRNTKPVPVAAVSAERRSNRSKKKTRRYSDDDEEKPKMKIKSDRTVKEPPPPTKPAVKPDESVDYDPPVNRNTRKRKAAEEKPVAISEPPPPPAKASSKSKKTTTKAVEPIAKAGPSTAIVVAKEEKPAASKRSKKQPPADVKPPVEPIVVSDSGDEQSGASETDSSGATRKSSRASKPRLMFTKMSPEPYRRMITRAAARKGQR